MIFQGSSTAAKDYSLLKIVKQKKSNHSTILEYSTFNWAKDPDTSLFNSAWKNMIETKPLPKQKKKTCYNYKCKHLKQWTFDPRGKLE